MADNRRLETIFLGVLAAALAILAAMHWAAYFIGPATWETSWPAIPLTAGALVAAIGAFALSRRVDKVRLMR